MNEEKLLTRRRVQQIETARAVEGELLDLLVEVADRWRQLRELKADDTALTREMRRHRIARDQHIPAFWAQLAMPQVFRNALDQIAKRVAKARESHRQLPPAISHRRRTA